MNVTLNFPTYGPLSLLLFLVESHVSRNKKQRKTVRDNVKTAKQTYLEEVKNSGVLPDTCVAEM